MQREIVGLDTAPLIYFIEENPDYLKYHSTVLRCGGSGRFSSGYVYYNPAGGAGPSLPAWKHDTSSTIQAELAARIGIPKSTFSRTLSDMERRKLIVRYDNGMSKMVKLADSFE
nr:hypothetical protein GZ26B2_10 [uncultured archaeon GZfos26B2]